MNLFALSGLLAGINSFIFGIFSWVKGEKFLNKIWAFFNLSVAIWGIGAYKFSTTLDKEAVFFWLRFGHIGVIFIPVLFLHFVFEFLGEKNRKIIYLTYGIGLFFSILNITDWLGITKVFIVSLRFVFNSFYVDSPPGPIYPLFVLFFFSIVIYAHLKGLKHLKLASGLQRMQIKYFLAATALGFGGGGTAFPMVFNIDIYPILHFTVCLYPIIMTYAIFKYRLMDINLVFRGGLIFFSYYVIALAATLPLIIFTKGNTWLLIITWGIVLAVVPLFREFMKPRATRMIDSVVFNNHYNYQDTLDDFIEQMPFIARIEDLFQCTAKTLTEALGIKKAAVLVLDTASKSYSIKAQIGLDGVGALAVPVGSKLIEWLKTNKEILIREELEKTLDKKELEPIKGILEKLNSSIYIPAMLETELIGFVCLGEKQSGEMYSHIDLRILQRLGIQLAVSINYKRMEAKLREQEALAYIMTMAKELSHQFRNRLTAAQTYFQMLPEKQNDPVFAKQFTEVVINDINAIGHKLTEMMFFSNLEKPRPKYTPPDIIIKASLILVQKQVKDKNIELHRDEEKNLPQIYVDEELITNALSSLIDNAAGAVGQTGGKIEISMRLLNEVDNDMKQKSEQWLRIVIKDNGYGMSRETQEKIYKPFFTTRSGGTEVLKMGVGLGLVTSKMIIEDHGGKVNIQSEENKGTVVTIDLPVANKELLNADNLPPEGRFYGYK